jgi:hypothetical protein
MNDAKGSDLVFRSKRGEKISYSDVKDIRGGCYNRKVYTFKHFKSFAGAVSMMMAGFPICKFTLWEIGNPKSFSDTLGQSGSHLKKLQHVWAFEKGNDTNLVIIWSESNFYQKLFAQVFNFAVCKRKNLKIILCK